MRLRKQIEQSSYAFNRSIFWRDVREMGIGVVVGILMFVLSAQMIWSGTLPVFFATGLMLFVLTKSDLDSRWADDPVGASLFLGFMIGVMLVSFVLDYSCKKKPIQNELLPRKQELESLQSKLMESETKSA